MISLRACVLLWVLAIPAQAVVDVPPPDSDSLAPHVAAALDQARQRFDDLERPSGVDWGELGMLYHAHGLKAVARASYQNAVELAPGDARWSYYLGLVLMEQGEFEAALAAFDASLKSNPYYMPAQVNAVRARIELGAGDAVLSDLRDLASRYPSVAAIHADLGRLLSEQGDSAGAVTAYERALELQPTASALRYPLALAYRDLGDMEQARINMQRRGEQAVIVEDPLRARMMSASRSYSYFLTLGVRAADNGDLDQALVHLQRAREIAPDNVFVLQTLARVREARGEMAVAVELLDRVLSLEPDFALALEHRGMLHEIDGDELSAEIFYERALEKDPGLAEARILFANVLLRAGRYQRAAEQYARLLQLHPDRVESLLRQAAAHYEAGQCAAAVAALAELLQKVPGNPGHFMAYARVVSACPQSGEADRRNALNGMRELYRLDPSVHVATTLAMIEAANGSFEVAADLQASAMFLMLRDQRQDEIQDMQAVLEGYRAGRAPTRPWQPGHPLVKPPRLRAEDRR